MPFAWMATPKCRPPSRGWLCGAGALGVHPYICLVCKAGPDCQSLSSSCRNPTLQYLYRRAVSGALAWVQADIHSPATTVHEALMFSARLRLSSSVGKERLAAFVEEVSQQSGAMSSCATCL